MAGNSNRKQTTSSKNSSHLCDDAHVRALKALKSSCCLKYIHMYGCQQITEALTFGTKVRMMCSHRGKGFILDRNVYCVTTPQLQTFHTYPGTRA